MASGLHQRSGIGQMPVRTEGSAKCSIHRNKKVVFVCSDCDELICTTCCVSGHRNHTLEEIADVISRKKGKLLNFVNDSEENKLPELRKELKSVEEKVAETEHNLGTVLPEKIKQHGEMCKGDIDRYIGQLKSSCQEKKNENIESLLLYKNDIQERYEHLVQMTKECKQALQSGTSVLVFDKVKDVESFKSEPFNMPVLRTTDFKPGTDISQHIRQAIGTLDTCTPGHKPGTSILHHIHQAIDRCLPGYPLLGTDKPEKDKYYYIIVDENEKELSKFDMLKIFVLVFIIFMAVYLTMIYMGINCTKMSTLIPTSDGRAWFHDKKSEAIKLLGHRSTETTYHDMNILDVGLFPPTGNLWLCSENIPAVFMIDRSSNTTCPMFYRFATCLHVTKEGNLVVGWLLVIQIVTRDGTFLRTSENDFYNFYGIPVQIVECPITGNIAAVHVLPWKSHIIVYNSTLGFLFDYDLPGAGWNSVVSIAYDSFGNIVIGESRTHTVYMISGTGKYIKRLFDIKGELSSLAIQTPCNILWAAVEHNIFEEVVVVEVKQRLLDLPNPSDQCKQLRENALKTVYETITDSKKGNVQDVISYIKYYGFGWLSLVPQSAQLCDR